MEIKNGNKSHVNVMGPLRNRTRKNHRGGYRYSELGMKGLTIALTDGAMVNTPKKVGKVRKSRKVGKSRKSRKSRKVKKGVRGKKGRTVRRGKGSPKRGKKGRR